MNKIRIAIVIIVVIPAVVVFPKTTSISSPDGKKTISLFYPWNHLWTSEIYLVPYQYKGLLKPKTNYVRLRPQCGDAYFTVNWFPSDKYSLKIYCACHKAFLEMSKNNTFYYAQDDPEGYLDVGDVVHTPKYSTFTIRDAN